MHFLGGWLNGVFISYFITKKRIQVKSNETPSTNNVNRTFFGLESLQLKLLSWKALLMALPAKMISKLLHESKVHNTLSIALPKVSPNSIICECIKNFDLKKLDGVTLSVTPLVSCEIGWLLKKRIQRLNFPVSHPNHWIIEVRF